jgi:peroxiredoxin
MTQTSANILLRIEQLLNAGKQQEARVLLVDFIQLNPASARAWWLLSLTVTDTNRQVACLRRVLRLDPENKLARERLAKLISQLPEPPSVSPFTSSIMGEIEETVDDISLVPAWARPVGAEVVSGHPQPPAGKKEPSVIPSAPTEPETPSIIQPAPSEFDTPSRIPSVPGELETPSGLPPVPSEPEVSSIIPPAPSELEMSSDNLTVASEPEVPPGMPPVLIEPRDTITILPAPIESKAFPTVPSATIEPQASPNVPTAPREPGATSSIPPASIKPGGKAPRSRQPNTKWEIVYILMTAFAILAIASIAGYISIQRKSQAQAQALALAQAQKLQETLVVAQTLTSLPLPTLIPTWTSSLTRTGLPTATFTRTPTHTPTLKYTLTRTPRPFSLIGPAVGLYAPDFSLTNESTRQLVKLSQFDGQPVLLFFWTTLCAQCNHEMGSIETISQSYKDTRLVVLTINAGENLATVSAYRTTHHLTVPVLLDPDSVAQNAYKINVDNLPQHFFIDSNGRIASIRNGEMTLDEIKIQVDAILRQFPTSTP